MRKYSAAPMLRTAPWFGATASGLSNVLAMKPHVPGVKPRLATNSSAVTLASNCCRTAVSYGDLEASTTTADCRK
jgi:hypothetical protein